jgi:transcriptional regulator with GAF, ATPase, and Fis domain
MTFASPSPNSLTLRRCKLIATSADGSATEYIFDQPQVTLGALEDNDLVLDDDRVSRHHARIFSDGDAFLIEDLRSATGTYVDRVRVREAWLRSGCSVRLGGTTLRFSVVTEKLDLRPRAEGQLGNLVGQSETMRRLMAAVEKVAPTGATVVLEGETGTGKEVVARTLHHLSTRATQPFIVFDCSAVQQNLIESELFGHEKGSFTGALATRQGLFELAHGGTIFLDEVGELALDLQPKLLRALETREIRRVGGNRPIQINVRVLAATNRDLQAEVKAGRFREDLFYRLGVVRLHLPPLRERREDIRLLAEHMLRTGAFNRGVLGKKDQDGQRVKGLSQEALQLLHDYDWPGNVRELGNIVERACSFAEGDLLQADDLPESIRGPDAPRRRQDAHAPTEPLAPPPSVAAQPIHMDLNFRDAKESWLGTFERDYLAAILTRHGGNLSQAARDADVDRKHFRRLARKHNLIAGKPGDDEEEP